MSNSAKAKVTTDKQKMALVETKVADKPRVGTKVPAHIINKKCAKQPKRKQGNSKRVTNIPSIEKPIGADKPSGATTNAPTSRTATRKMLHQLKIFKFFALNGTPKIYEGRSNQPHTYLIPFFDPFADVGDDSDVFITYFHLFRCEQLPERLEVVN
ncbi:hypothetical protein L1987_37455 [Smallanthus sonchifolius]|uniref:Uncharacterized protein n=1 Tax=Smallanthus sonchifolius TaxID=185202 RepID=A0ACB9HHS5_9ASTR|nr:hypothetical protein L1987_37455 [Smallanthus sonchifolius]